MSYLPFLIFIALVIVGSSNAVNLTDGLDGLAIGCVVVAAGALTVLTYVTSHAGFSAYLDLPHIPQVGELTVFCGALMGSALGFLWYNAHPAEVFMGDVGSLALGGSIGMIAVAIKQEILLFFVGGVFVIEAVSVILQVASFRLTGKRIFRMSPLHHHFELAGWSESKIIVRFWIAALVFALFSLTTLKLRRNCVRSARNGETVEAGNRTRGQAGAGRGPGAHGRRHGAVLRCARRARHRHRGAPRTADRRDRGEAARRRRHAGAGRPRPAHICGTGFDRAESRCAADHAGAGRRARHRHSGMERNRAGLEIFARPPDLHHRLQWQDHHDGPHRPYPGNRGTARAGRGKYRHAADLARGRVERHGLHRGRGQQLSAGIDCRVSSGRGRAAESHAGPSRPPRVV